MGRRKQQRRGVTAQLVTGQDDDLIEWLDSLTPGTRQQAIKDMLRVALGLPVPAPINNGADLERVQYLETWMHQMAGAYNDLVRRMDSIASLPAAALTSSEPVEAAPQMSADEQQQRAKKLKKASW